MADLSYAAYQRWLRLPMTKYVLDQLRRNASPNARPPEREVEAHCSFQLGRYQGTWDAIHAIEDLATKVFTTPGGSLNDNDDDSTPPTE